MERLAGGTRGNCGSTLAAADENRFLSALHSSLSELKFLVCKIEFQRIS